MDNIERLERRHFALPAAFVLTLLAFLFFGTTRPPISVSPVVVPPKTPLTTRDMVEIKDYIPPPIDDPDPDPMAKPDNGGGGQRDRPCQTNRRSFIQALP